MALSPNGNRLVVSWYDQNKKLHAKFVELNGAAVASVRDITLPPSTFTTEFANNSQKLLVTTNVNGASDLIKVAVDSGAQTLIYKSAHALRYPVEVSDGNYVFLEGEPADQRNPANRFSRWQRYQQGQKTLLHDRLFGRATELNVIGESLFLFAPVRTFLAIHGTVPGKISSLIQDSTWNIVCADKNPLICVRDSLHIESGSYLAKLSIFNDQHKCDIAEKWLDLRELKISRTGNTTVFHAALEELNGPRAIYAVNNAKSMCTAKIIPIETKN